MCYFGIGFEVSRIFNMGNQRNCKQKYDRKRIDLKENNHKIQAKRRALKENRERERDVEIHGMLRK